MWVAVEDVGHVLRKGDHIKLGRYTIGVRQIVLSGSPQIPNFSSIKDAGTALMGFTKDPDATCRICLDSAESEEDPMIKAPCLCKGGMQYIHLGCLRHWLATRYSVDDRLQPPTEGAAAYSFKPPACDICKAEFPTNFPQGQDQEPVTLLTNLPLLKPPFIVFSLPRSPDKERPHGERCVFAPGTGATLRIGRSQDSGLQLLDVSVSRIHATVVFRGNDFILQNNEARFGTSVMPQGPRALPSADQGSLSIQAGGTLLRLAMEPMHVEERHEGLSL
jgi:pSer/pThr/pTyr-binding forkhead associated (FHA) protein